MDEPDSGQLLTALTTEHFTLQGARSQTMSETSSRAAVYMYSVSSALAALGFVSQVADGSDTVFGIFALTILPTIYVLGCATYVRLVECSAEDLRYGVAINRIRGYYKEIAGARADLFVLSGHDDGAGVFANIGLSPDRRSPAFAFSTAIAVVNGVVGGAVVGIVVNALVDGRIWLSVSVGVLVAAASGSAGCGTQLGSSGPPPATSRRAPRRRDPPPGVRQRARRQTGRRSTTRLGHRLPAQRGCLPSRHR